MYLPVPPAAAPFTFTASPTVKFVLLTVVLLVRGVEAAVFVTVTANVLSSVFPVLSFTVTFTV